MPDIEIYTKDYCPYCTRAKELLDSKNVEYTEYDITGDDAAQEKMAERTGGPRTVPQIFVDGEPVGGCDEIHALDEQGKLDPLLAA